MSHETFKMRRVDRIHFVGLGGVGMSGIAEVLLNQGYHISGSDIAWNPSLRRLESLGARVQIGHEPLYVLEADVVVVSSAVDANNVELEAARARRIPLVPRAGMLAELMRFRYGIAVAGTHGKTTTTSLLASVLAEAGLDPTFVIGGRLNSAGVNARLGVSRYLVAEADESDASFLHLNPMISIVTNIDEDHLPTYEGDFNRLKQAFVDFLEQLPFYGLAVLCMDDEQIRSLIPSLSRPFVTYGFDVEADYRIIAYRQEGTRSYFSVSYRNNEPWAFCLNLPGRHNAENATAVLAVALEEGVSPQVVGRAFEQFSGVGRRFQVWGEYPLVAGGQFLLMDDYGHHPREVEVTAVAVKAAWPERRLVMVYQPHRYTRTRDTFDETVSVLSKVDVVVLLNVYSAGEAVIPGVNSEALCEALKLKGCSPYCVEDADSLWPLLSTLVQANDVLLLQGAGSVGGMAADLSKRQGQFLV